MWRLVHQLALNGMRLALVALQTQKQHTTAAVSTAAPTYVEKTGNSANLTPPHAFKLWQQRPRYPQQGRAIGFAKCSK